MCVEPDRFQRRQLPCVPYHLLGLLLGMYMLNSLELHLYDLLALFH